MVTGELLDREYDKFEKWWDEYGQYCRAGGHSYHRSFAWEAWLARAEQAEAALSVAQKDAGKWRQWTALQKRIEEEMPEGYAVELYCSPGDWDISLTAPGGKAIEIHDYDDMNDFVRRAIDAAIAHGGAGEGEGNA